jgi:hypothetical protein
VKKTYMFEAFKGTSGYWYWRLLAGNHKIVADGSEGYSSKAACKKAVRRVWNSLVLGGVIHWYERN